MDVGTAAEATSPDDPADAAGDAAPPMILDDEGIGEITGLTGDGEAAECEGEGDGDRESTGLGLESALEEDVDVKGIGGGRFKGDTMGLGRFISGLFFFFGGPLSISAFVFTFCCVLETFAVSSSCIISPRIRKLLAAVITS